MDNKSKFFFKIVPVRAYFAISMPIVFIFVFFSLFKFHAFNMISFFVAIATLGLILLIVNGAFYFSETRTPFIKVEDKKVFYRFKHDWIQLQNQSCKIDFDRNILEITTTGKILTGYMNEENLRDLISYLKR